MLKCSIECQELMKEEKQNGMKHVIVNADQMRAFVIINNIRMMINAGVNVKNQWIKVYVINDLFEILVIMAVNVISHVILGSIQTIKTVSAGKSQLINSLKNVLQLLMTEFSFVENKFKHNSCTLYIVLFSIVFTINVGIATYFVYSHWCLKKDVARINFGTCTQTTI